MKTAMAAERKRIQGLIKVYKMARKLAVKEGDLKEKNRLASQIEHLERNIKFYKASVEPVQFSNGFVLDGALLKQFVKKLPAMQLEAEFTADSRIIEIKHKSGKITLYDLKDRYQGLKMRKGEELFDELGITLS